MSKALEGIRVLDFTHVQSGPTCTHLPASVNNYGVEQKMTAARNNERAAFQDETLALDIEAAFIRVFPLVFLDASPDRELVRIGSDFKVYQYARGQYFKPHRDGDVSVDGVTSLVTVLVYRNDADGGTTVIMLVLSGAGSMTLPRRCVKRR